MNYRDLEAVRQIVDDATGLDISYAYDDLVFPENGAFIIQFDEESNDKLHCFFHQDCNSSDAENIFANLTSECQKKKCTIEKGSSFMFEQDGENVKIIFS